MNTTAEPFAGYIIDALSREQGCPDAIGYVRPLRAEDLDAPNAEIEPRWVWVEWWYAPNDRGDGPETVGWREGDAVFVPADATLGASEYAPDGPKGKWILAENPRALVVAFPEDDNKRTLCVLT